MFLGLTTEQWRALGISSLIILLAVAVGQRLIRFIINRGIKRLTKRTETTFDDVILEAVHPPLYWLLVVIALDVGMKRLDFLPEGWNAPLQDIFFVLYLSVAVVFTWRLTSRMFIWYGREVAVRTQTELDTRLMPFFRRVALIMVGAIGLIIVLGHFEVNVNALVTTLGIGSLAIALAAQAALEDTISGFLIMLDQPFRIGDRIEIQDLDTWGDVVDIGLRSSRIRTRDNRMVVIPNSVIGESLVVNYAYPDSQYRIEVEIGVAYGVDLEHVRRTMIAAVRDVEGVLSERPVEALLLEFGDSTLIFRVRWWIDSYVDTRQMFDKVNSAIYYALNEEGIATPFPQQDVHHKIDPEDVDLIASVLRGTAAGN